jgi:ketosteroid isomerase-like protein
MKRMFVSICLLLLIPAFALGQSSNKNIEAEILKLRTEIGNGVADFERLTTSDFILTFQVPAKPFTRAEMIERLKTPSYKSESRTVDDHSVRVYGDAAIATGRIKEVRKYPDGRTANFEARFTEVWVKQNGKWLLATRHASPAFGVFKPE